MKEYIWQQNQWPQFSWNSEVLLIPLASARKKQGAFLEAMSRLGFEESLEAWSKVMEEDTIQTSAIEGEKLDREGVRSSVAEHLGVPSAGFCGSNRKIDGIVQILCDAVHNRDTPLDEMCIKTWHKNLFPDGYSGFHTVHAGEWRSTDMQVISGPIGRQKIHYIAPPPERIAQEMATFFLWWETSKSELDGLIRSALAHLYFVSIHPFDDGNGRIARALSDMALAQDEKTGRRFYSMSAQIMEERRMYYEILEKTQKGNGDCTEWLLWFIGCFERAITEASEIAKIITFKSTFWVAIKDIPLSERQRKVLNILLDAGKDGFEGGLTTRKYVGMTKVSRATAWREIEDLVEKGILRQLDKGGRSTAYEVNWAIQCSGYPQP